MIDVESLHPSPVVGLASLLVSTVLSNLFFFGDEKYLRCQTLVHQEGCWKRFLGTLVEGLLRKNVVTGLCYRRYCTLAKGWFVDGNKGLNKR